MNLHQNNILFVEAILAAAQHFDIREIYIEKDYWVTVALYEIFHSEIAKEAVFKGGTALSKCHKLIDRFSEDIDIVVVRHDNEKDNQLKKRIRAISKVVEKIIPEIEVEGITNKKGNIRKTVHQYDKLYAGDFGQVSEHIVLEATWLGNFEPSSSMQVSCYISDMMGEKGQEKLINQYNMAPFTVQVLSHKRTFCEKIMSLVRFSRSEDPITDLRQKIRHIYDLNQMLKNDELQNFFQSIEFDNMINKVGNDDMISFKNNNEWIPEHPLTALIFDKPEETWVKLSTEYNTTFKELVTGEFPEEGEIINCLIIIAKRLKKVDWRLS